ncbi:MAG: MotA/TolQ/ExbB proton channel family protein [Muribaculaceae bacterium]|nr:MotA/TolQ/ExbB proton channel family protein [Muribaculaceae bacterium]
MNVISDILYWISTGLLVPVIVLLIFFFVRALLLIGSFFGEYMQNRRVNASLGARISRLTAADAAAFARSLPASGGSLFETYARKIACSAGDEARTDLLLSEFEIESDKNIAASKVLTKMGPILGLMGTLIPMGPALVGLAQGDISSMAYNMQVAFATTVVGLTVSAIGFCTQQAKERWAVSRVALLEYLARVAAAAAAERRDGI